MSWFTRSIANTFNLNNDQDNPDTNSSKSEQQDSPKQGVKEDLSEITTKIWGVASFLAPPSNHQSDPVTGIRRDFAEIGGRFRSGISKLSNNIDVSEITKLASNILKLSPDAEAVGVTDQVLGFVRDVTMHPETWMDFPLLEDEEFELSDAQQEHALAVESLVPRLPALRIELCPGYMSEGSFWKIYFVLVHPKLEPHVAELLSTPEIVKARGSLTHELNARCSVPSGTQPETLPLETSALPLTTSGVPVAIEETEKDSEKDLVPTEEIQIVDKSVIQEEPSRSITNAVEDKDEDDWLKEDGSENVNVSGAATVHVENDEDVSFSDLEDDEDGGDVGKVSVDKSEMKE